MATPVPPLRVDVVADGATTAGAFVVLDVHLAAGAVVPPHTHARQDAALLVLEGELAVACGDERRCARAGAPVALPRGAPCRLEARADTRVLVLAVPAGLEALLDLARPGDAVDPDDLAALLAVAGVALLPTAWGRAAA